MNNIQIKSYLKRIGYEGELSVHKSTLDELHLRNVLSVPFENIDVHMGKLVSICTQDVFEKVVENNRGGYCFEVNALFGDLLESLGFNVSYHGSRVWYGYNPAQGVRPRAHQILLVELENARYLVDVSFGKGIILPLDIELESEQHQYNRNYRVIKDSEFGYKIEEKLGSGWLLLFSFTLETTYPADYEVASYYATHSPNSIFTQKLVCTLPTETGRNTILDGEYSEQCGDRITRQPITSNRQLLDILKESFRIQLPASADFSRFINSANTAVAAIGVAR
jgi:N-hydroxyarylamine O-acetyltransferase